MRTLESTGTTPSAFDLEEILGGIPCQGEAHPRGANGHVIDAPAAFMMVCPGCGPSVLQCAPRVRRMHEFGHITCMLCRKTWPFEQWGKIPL